MLDGIAGKAATEGSSKSKKEGSAAIHLGTGNPC
jgi:hypothetical protein